MSDLRDNMLRYGSYALVLMAPLVFLSHRLYPHISTKTFFIYGMVEILFFIWIYALIVDRSYWISKKILLYFLPVLSFVIWMSTSGILAVNPHLSFWSSLGRGTGLLTLYHSLALSLVIASLVKKHGISYVISLFQWFITGAFLLAISIWLGTEGFKSSITALEKDAGGGLAGNSTLAAGYLLFALAVAGFLISSKNALILKKKFLITSVAVIIFSPVFVSLYGLFAGSGLLGTARGTLLAIGAGIVASGVGYMFLSEKKAVKWASVATVVIGLTAFFFLWFQLITPGTFLNTKFSEEARNSRFIFWEIAQKAMNERPIFGYGPENYSIAYQKYFNPKILVIENNFEGWNDRAHNIYYELGATAGYPAIILYSIFLLSLFYAGYRLHKENHVNRWQASIIAGLLVAYVVNNLFTFDSSLSLMGLFIVVGILYSLGNPNDNSKFSPVKISQLNKNLVAGGLIGLFLVSFAFLVYMPSKKSRAYSETFASAINKRSDMYPSLLKGSSVGSDWDTSGLAFEVYKKYASNPKVVKDDPKVLPYAIKDITALLEYLEKVSETKKYDYRLYITRTFLQNNLTYLMNTLPSEDLKRKNLEALERAEALSPTNPNVYWSKAQIKVWEKDFDGAETAYRRAIAVAPTLPASYNLALKYAQVLNDQKLFNEWMMEAKENIPGYELK